MNVRARLSKLEQATRERRDIYASAARKFDEKFTRLMNDPTVPEEEKRAKCAFIIGFLVNRRGEKQTLEILNRINLPHPEAWIAEGTAEYRRIVERRQVH